MEWNGMEFGIFHVEWTSMDLHGLRGRGQLVEAVGRQLE